MNSDLIDFSHGLCNTGMFELDHCNLKYVTISCHKYAAGKPWLLFQVKHFKPITFQLKKLSLSAEYLAGVK